jgi:hypothetical protein
MANANRTAPRLGIDDPDAWTAQKGIVKLDLTPFLCHPTSRRNNHFSKT